MKSIGFAVVAFFILVVPFLAEAGAQQASPAGRISDEPHIITVAGDAEVNVDPDYVEITINVATQDKNIQKAKAENDDIVNSLKKASADFKIPDDDLRVDFLDIYPRYEVQRNSREFVGYYVSNTLVVTLRDLSQYNALISELIESGAKEIRSVVFKTSELRKYKDKARDMAVKAAKEKATDMAGALAQTIGDAVNIKEIKTTGRNYYGGRYRNYYRGAANPFNATTDIDNADSETESMTGKISITASVNVSFLLE